MKWINEHKRIIRIAFLILLVIAIFGPWVFDTIPLPPSYPCSPLSVRLDDTHCGWPMSITFFYSAFFSEFSNLLVGFVRGSASFTEVEWSWFFMLILILLLMPFLSAVILALRGDHRSWLIFHRMGLSLAAAIGGWITWLSFSRASWMLWGLWLYIGLTISMWVLEVMIWRIPRKLVQE